eukprot:5890836-Pyramimonas_sp.AAC.1
MVVDTYCPSTEEEKSCRASPTAAATESGPDPKPRVCHPLLQLAQPLQCLEGLLVQVLVRLKSVVV